MIKIKFKALFTLDFSHTYYKSGKCSDIGLYPSANCKKLIQSLGLHFLPTEFGGKLYAKVNEADKIKNPLPNGTKFTFLLKLKNNHFENITNLNLLKPVSSHYYFNNLKANLLNAEPLLTANTTNKVVSDIDLLPFVSNSFSFANTSTLSSQVGRLEFTDSGEHLEQTVSNSNNTFNFSFNLNKTSGGRGKFLVDGVDTKRFFVIEAAESADLFGLVEIFYTNSLPNENQFQADNHSITTRNYKIPFSNRFTKWRYIITKQFNPEVSTVSIAKTDGTSIDFSLLGSSPPGKFIVTSNNILPLSEEPVTGIKLKDQSNKIIIANLPNPPRNLIKTEGADTFSDILITI